MGNRCVPILASQFGCVLGCGLGTRIGELASFDDGFQIGLVKLNGFLGQLTALFKSSLGAGGNVLERCCCLFADFSGCGLDGFFFGAAAFAAGRVFFGAAATAATASTSLFTLGSGAALAAFAEIFAVLRAILASINHVALHNKERERVWQVFFVRRNKKFRARNIWRIFDVIGR
jgi:hypothetical protein